MAASKILEHGRVVLVHERLTELGGSERVVAELARMWPQARLLVPVADPEAVPAALFGSVSPQVSALQRLYRGGGSYAHLLALLPLAMATADLQDADLVLTSHHAFANRVRPPRSVPVISYTHSPARWMWDPQLRRGEVGGRVGGAGLAGFAATQRRADRRAAARLAGVIANSTAVAERILRWWGLNALVVAPPVDVERYRPSPSTRREDFFLLAGRLVPYKRPEVAAAAARRAGVRLVVAGEGRARDAVARAGGSAVCFVGRPDDATLRELYQRCQALVFPGEEDFGIVPVEAQACGTPVVALDAGGARDSVIDRVTGILVPPRQAVADQIDAFAAALAGFDANRFDPLAIRRNAEQFSPDHFARRFDAAVAQILERWADQQAALPRRRRTRTQTWVQRAGDALPRWGGPAPELSPVRVR